MIINSTAKAGYSCTIDTETIKTYSKLIIILPEMGTFPVTRHFKLSALHVTHYNLTLQGPETRFYLEPSTLSKFSIYTYADFPENKTKAYLQPLSAGNPQDENVIGAKIEENPSYFFEIKSTNLPYQTNQS